MRYLISCALLGLTISQALLAAPFKAGVDYDIITQSTPSVSDERANVTEYFSYACTGCYHLESSLHHWLKSVGETVDFDRVPIVYQAAWEPLAKAYFIAVALDKEAMITPAIFAKSAKKGAPLSNEELATLFTQHGVDAKTAKAALSHSVSIDLEVSQAKHAMQRFHITSIPTVVVNDKYKVSLQQAKNPERFFAIVDHLIRLSQNNKR